MINILKSPEFYHQLIANWLFLSLLGMAFMVTYRTGFINLGITAQLITGALTACFVGSSTGNFLLAIMACLVVTTIVGIIPVFFKYVLNANEILTTLFFSFLAISIGQIVLSHHSALSTATPRVPLVRGFWGNASGGYLTAFHFLAIPSAIGLWLFLEHSVLGYQIRVLESSQRVFGPFRKLMLVSLTSVIGSVFIVFAVAGDTYLVKGVYQHGAYDTKGFIGVAVALIALKKPKWVLLAGFIIALIEQLFLVLSVEYDVPEMAAQILYGIGILVAATYLRKNERVST